MGKRNKADIRTMWCCYHLHKRGLFGKLVLCEHLVNKSCDTKCISCKLFMCDELKIRYRIRDFILLDYFFNFAQKIIIKAYCFKSKEEIMKNLLFWGL